ncbi:MAG: hypothetical protein JNL70_12335 [Saprospiraceae bacterium]|nr:hypothetical protein [Saprospiraceae bacterium]
MGSHIYSQFHNPKYLILFALGGLLFFTPSVLEAQTYIMGTAPASNNASIAIPANTTVNFYDDGGAAGNYTNSQNRTVTFTAPTGYQLKIVFSVVDLPGNTNIEDYLEVHDGTSNSSSPYLAQLGHYAPATYITTTSAMTLQLVTNGSVVGAGFAATVETIPITEYPLNTTNQGTTTSVNLGIITDDGGISSNYANSQDRSYTFCSNNGYPLILDFLNGSSNFGDNNDTLFVYNGNSINAPLIGTLMDLDDEINFVSTNASNCLTIRFKSSASGVDFGFRGLLYTANQTGVTFVKNCWGGATPIPNAALTANAGKNFVLNRNGFYLGNAPVCMIEVDGTGMPISNSEHWAFCTEVSDYGGIDYRDQVGTYVFTQETVGAGTTTVTATESAKIAWILSNYQNYGYSMGRSGDRREIQNAIWKITDAQACATALCNAIPTNPSTATPTLILTRNTALNLAKGSTHTFTLQTDQTELTLKVSDNGSLPTVTSGNGSVTTNTDGSGKLTITGGGTQTLQLSLSRNTYVNIELFAIANQVITNPNTFTILKPSYIDVQDFFPYSFASINTTSPIQSASANFICIEPTIISVASSVATCTGSSANNNGKITLTAATNADKYGVSTGTTYTGAAYAAATTLGTLPIDVQTAIPNTGGTYTIRLFNGANDCYKDTTVIVAAVTCSATCAITLIPSVSGCYQNGGSKATVSVEVVWENAPSGENIVVTGPTGSVPATRTITPGTISVNYGYGVTGNQTIVSPQVIAFEIPANGATGLTVSANFSTTTSCSATSSAFAAPAACEPLVCSTGANQSGGTVFSDYNADGIKSSGETNGLAGVTVKAFDCNGSQVGGTQTTDATGKYAFSGLTAGNYPIRVEFSGLPTLYGQGTPNGTNGRTTTQFVSAANCSVDLGVLDPNDYCQTNPKVFVPCFASGDPLVAGTAANTDATVMFDYSNSGLPNQTGGGYTAPTHIAYASQVGTLWGTAYNRNTKRIFQSAILKRHAGLGSQGIGGIYVTNVSNLASPTVSNFIDVETDLGIDLDNPSNPVLSNSARGLTGSKTAASNDSTVIEHIGRVGIGDLDISTNGDTLWFVNVYDKKLYAVDITAYNSDGTTKPTAANTTSFTIPDPNCVGGTARPFGLKIYKGDAYVGVICDGGTSQNKSNLRAYIYKLSGSTWTTVFDFPLTYPKGFADDNPALIDRTGWYPWTDDWNTYTATTRDLGGRFGWVYPMPILSDIEFDIDGSMIIGFTDRAGFIGGNWNYRPVGNSLLYSNTVGGDILRAYYSSGSYVLENAAKTGTSTGYGVTNQQGPGFGEFYDENLVWSYNGDVPKLAHAETSLGGLGIRPGSGEIMSTAIDPVNYNIPADWSSHPFDAGGVITSNNSTGAKNNSYVVYQGQLNNGLFGKTAGLGDIELGCATPQYLQIGNYVWQDSNKDGVQDPCEPPLSNVTVTLWKGGTQIASTTTNSSGEYYFSDKNASGATWTGTGADTILLPTTAYEVRIDTSNQSTFIKLALTTANSTANNGNDQNDNDAVTTGKYKVISFTTGAVGSVNHTYDFGFYPFCDTTLVVTNATICNGATVDLFTLASGVKGTLSYSTNGTTWTALTNLTNVTPSVTTTYYIKDTLVSGCFDIDTLVITVNPTPTTPSVSSPITNICPLPTVDLTVISSALTPSVSGGVYEWHVSNSSGSALVSNPNDVVAGDYYLFERSPAGCYSIGKKVTVAIQVCCPPQLCIPVAITRTN